MRYTGSARVDIFTRGEKFVHTHKEDNHGRIETEIGVMGHLR